MYKSVFSKTPVLNTELIVSSDGIVNDRISKFAVTELADALGVFLIQKGENDMIYGGHSIFCTSSASGSLRRCGGQGDLLAGITGLFLYYGLKSSISYSVEYSLYVACKVVRDAAAIAFKQHGRSTTTVQILEKLEESFARVYNYNQVTASL